MTNKEILEIALEQSAFDCLCRWNAIWYPTAITL